MPGDRHFLQIEGIKGESEEAGHKDWMEVDSMEFGVTNRGPGGEGLGIPSFTDVTMVRRLDRASVKLAFHCAAGTIFSDVEFHATMVIKGKNEIVYVLKLKSAAIKSYNILMPENAAASERIQLGFKDIEASYTVRDPRTGDPKGKSTAGYHIARNDARGVGT